MGTQAVQAVLESWKEIAAYLKRTERTFRRWEKELGLPVHRIEDSPRARVFAYKNEVDDWIERAGDLGSAQDIRRSREASPAAPKRYSIYGAMAIATIVILLVAWLWVHKKAFLFPYSAPIRSIAVLPFEDLSPEKNQEHLADGITDALTNALCSVPDLWVSARTSSYFFKGKKIPLSEIGRLLHAEVIIEGSLQVNGETMRLTVQMADASNGYHLWSQMYDRPLDDIFALQNEVAQAVVQRLKGDFLHTR